MTLRECAGCKGSANFTIGGTDQVLNRNYAVAQEVERRAKERADYDAIHGKPSCAKKLFTTETP